MSQPDQPHQIILRNNTLPTKIIEQASNFSANVKSAARGMEVELKEIRPRETQALFDELEERWKEGTLF